MTLDQPELVERMMQDPDSYQTFSRHTDSEFEIPHVSQVPEIKVGVMGFPEGSTAELGRKIFEECVAGLAALITK
jgi:hypothetical protein